MPNICECVERLRISRTANLDTMRAIVVSKTLVFQVLTTKRVTWYKGRKRK